MGPNPSSSAPAPSRPIASASVLPAIREEEEDATSSAAVQKPRSGGAGGASEPSISAQATSFRVALQKGEDTSSSGSCRTANELKRNTSPSKPTPPAHPQAQPRPFLLSSSSDYISPTAFFADVARQRKDTSILPTKTRTTEARVEAYCAEQGCLWKIVAVPRAGRWAVAAGESCTVHMHRRILTPPKVSPSAQKTPEKASKGVGRGNGSAEKKQDEARSGGHHQTRSKTAAEPAHPLIAKQSAPRDNEWTLATGSEALASLIDARSFVFATQRSYSDPSLIKQSHNLVESYIEANKVKAASQTRKLSTALGAWTAFCSNFAVNIPVFPIIPSVVTLFAVHITIVKTSVPTQQLQALEELRKITAPIWRSKLDAEATTTLFDLPVLKDFLGEYGISLGGPVPRKQPTAAPRAFVAAQAPTEAQPQRQPSVQSSASLQHGFAASKPQQSKIPNHKTSDDLKGEAQAAGGRLASAAPNAMQARKDARRADTAVRPTHFGASAPPNAALKPAVLPPLNPTPSTTTSHARAPPPPPRVDTPPRLPFVFDIKPRIPSKRRFEFDIVISDDEDEPDEKPVIHKRISSHTPVASDSGTPPAHVAKKPKAIAAPPLASLSPSSSTDDLRSFLNTLIADDKTFGDSFVDIFEEIGVRYPSFLLRWAGDSQKMDKLMQLLDGKIPPLLFEDLREGLLREVGKS